MDQEPKEQREREREREKEREHESVSIRYEVSPSECSGSARKSLPHIMSKKRGDSTKNKNG